MLHRFHRFPRSLADAMKLFNQDMDVLSKKLDPQAGVYIMPESEYRARKARKLRQELQEFALSNGVPVRS